jgi:2-polyprenyl-6-methoxyphenol hydroxylase-like FAD-dependent oxidoreductase
MPTDRVIVVGAGPVGMVTALGLGQAGVPVTVLERLDDLATESRASTFHPPTLELLSDLGVVDDLLDQGLKAPITQFRDRQHGPIAELDLGVLADDTPFPFRVQCEQHKLTRIIRDRLTGLDVEIEYGAPVTGIRLDGAEATVELGDGGTRTAPWVVAADGAHSAVRRSMDIDFEGETYPERFLVASTAMELRDHMPDLALVNYVADPDEWLVLLRTPDHWRILFPIPPDEDDDVAVSPARVQERLQDVLALPDGWPVDHVSIYVVNRRVAAQMRVGPVLLAGDAAHVNSPLGGMGMNSGIHDAVSAWRRLASVWGSPAGPEVETVMNEYDRLRREVAIEYVGADTHKNWEVLREPDPEMRAQHQDELRAVAADPVRARQRLLRAAMLDAVKEHL